MREIKFRAWEKDLKTMILPDSDTAYEYKLSIAGGIYFDGSTDESLILMQFTGLLDKNDKEIYEGDILKEGDSYKNFLVEYSEQSGGYKMPAWYDEEYIYLVGECPTEIEIIGNIYENPKLLKS